MAELLSDIDVSKSPGADGIQSKTLKHAAQELAPSLAEIFNLSLATGTLPGEWKEATISALHKKASTSDPTKF